MKQPFFLSVLFVLAACAPSSRKAGLAPDSGRDAFYSTAGQERRIQFTAEYRSHLRSLEELNTRRNTGYKSEILDTLQFLYGPLVNRNWGSPQRGGDVELNLSQAYVRDGRVMMPYTYQGTWILSREFARQNRALLPVPYDTTGLRTSGWQNCTDNSDEDHRTWSFFWYFWDPARSGCDHQEGRQYQNVNLQIGAATPQTRDTYPEYARLVRDEDGRKVLSMTFAFGYVEDLDRPQPFRDRDAGAREFQKFIAQIEPQVRAWGFEKSNITLAEYGKNSSAVMGLRYLGQKDGQWMRISVVVNAGIDQMELFERSYAHDNEGFFGWFGHSRVGSGFDADQFRNAVLLHPEQYAVFPDYQLIYWAGCNSYSYYTLPFFQMKANLNPAQDPHGTRNLDIISNGLPSLFSLNASNAMILFNALTDLKHPQSYQSLIDRIEERAGRLDTPVLVNVLGDEDND